MICIDTVQPVTTPQAAVWLPALPSNAVGLPGSFDLTMITPFVEENLYISIVHRTHLKLIPFWLCHTLACELLDSQPI